MVERRRQPSAPLFSPTTPDLLAPDHDDDMPAPVPSSAQISPISRADAINRGDLAEIESVRAQPNLRADMVRSRAIVKFACGHADTGNDVAQHERRGWPYRTRLS